MLKKYYQAVFGFFSDVKSEIGKVAFPTRNETLVTTTVVIMFVLLFSMVLSFVDSMLMNLIKIII